MISRQPTGRSFTIERRVYKSVSKIEAIDESIVTPLRQVAASQNTIGGEEPKYYELYSRAFLIKRGRSSSMIRNFFFNR